MGVKGLWSVLDPLADRQSTEQALGNRVLAVDLAGWAVSDNQCSGLSSVHRPHIRNVFFRLSRLILELNAWPIFVLDGRAPEMKADVLLERRQRESQDTGKQKNNLHRNRLKAVLNECRQLLSALGVETLQAESEAESLCAALNRANIVDAVLTEDSDVFCHGSLTVHRGFAKNQAFIETYQSDRMAESELKLSRDKLIFFAVVCGCDYYPSGVPNLGKDTLLKLFKVWPENFNALTELQAWIDTDFSLHKSSCECVGEVHCIMCLKWQKQTQNGNSGTSISCRCEILSKDASLQKIENSVKQKLGLLDKTFWHETYTLLLNEFDLNKEILPSIIEVKKLKTWQRPDLMKTCTLLGKKLGWDEDYAFIKVWPLLTRWQVLNYEGKDEDDTLLTAVKVIKKKKLKGVPCVVVEWKAEEAIKENLKTFQNLPEPLLSIEPSNLVSRHLGSLWEAFTNETAKKKDAKKRKRKDISICVSKKATKASVSSKAEVKSQKSITHFLVKQRSILKKKCKEPHEKRNSNAFLEALSNSMMEEYLDESVDELSFLVDDIISNNINDMSIDEAKSKKKSKVATSTPLPRASKSRTKDCFQPSRNPFNPMLDD